MKTGVIAFCGSKGSGKSTSATIFKELFVGPTEELAFAGHLKNVCSKVFSVDMENFINPALKERELDTYVVLNKTNIDQVFKAFNIDLFTFDDHIRPHMGQIFDTPRQLLQYIGTNLLHPLDPLIHVKMTMALKDPDKLTILTDLRFSQEFDFLCQRLDFLPVYVYNPHAEYAASGDLHPSETQLQTFKGKCEKVENIGDFEMLRTNLKEIIKDFYGQ